MMDARRLAEKNQNEKEGLTIDELGELKLALKGNPNCRFCRDKGNHGYYGVGKNPNGRYYLMLCCASIGETEYVRLQKAIATCKEEMGLEYSNMTTMLVENRRYTLIGGIAFIWRKIWKKSY
jgi:hypothetical protein